MYGCPTYALANFAAQKVAEHFVDRLEAAGWINEMDALLSNGIRLLNGRGHFPTRGFQIDLNRGTNRV